MKIGLIGCGKVGITLCYLLKKNNHIMGVYDINKRNEKRALRLLHIKKNLTLRELCRVSEVLFFATPDDQILRAYKKAKSFIIGEKYIFHFSGLLPAMIFPKRATIYRGSVHPFATFPMITIPPTRKNFFLFIEGDPKAQMVARKIFPKRYFILRKINKKDKETHHLIGVFSSNLLVGLMLAIYELTRSIHWEEKDFYNVVYPLIEETLVNIKKYGVSKALSGPIRRGDVKVIKKHLKALKKNKTLLNIYKTLSLNILESVTEKKRNKAIETLLKK